MRATILVVIIAFGTLVIGADFCKGVAIKVHAVQMQQLADVDKL